MPKYWGGKKIKVLQNILKSKNFYNHLKFKCFSYHCEPLFFVMRERPKQSFLKILKISSVALWHYDGEIASLLKLLAMTGWWSLLRRGACREPKTLLSLAVTFSFVITRLAKQAEVISLSWKRGKGK